MRTTQQSANSSSSSGNLPVVITSTRTAEVEQSTAGRCQRAPTSHASDGTCSCDVTPEDRLGRAYNEEAFQYFLAIERKRSERSGRPFLLLLVDLKEKPGVSTRIDTAAAHKLFSGLWRCLRGTDFVGWYRADHVVGAVVVESRGRNRAEVSRLVKERLMEALSGVLSTGVARRLRLRVYHQPAPQNILSGRLSWRD